MSDTKTVEKQVSKRDMLMKVSNAINTKAGAQVVGWAKDIAKPLRFIPTPSEELNLILGGGFPIGRITEVYGGQSSGKTSICLETIGDDMQRNPDSYWAWYESEESFDMEYAQRVHGVDPERLILIDTDVTGAEKSLDRLEAYMRSGGLTGFVVNSVAGLTPKKEMESDLEKQDIALQARMMSKLMRKWTALIGKKDICAIFINQLRTNVGQMFGDPNVTTGGRALAFYSTIRFGMSKVKLEEADPIKKDEGMKVSVIVAKNRCVYDDPYKKANYLVVYGEGVDKISELIDRVDEIGMMRKAGSWFYYEKEDGEQIVVPEATVDGKPVKDFAMKFKSRAVLHAFLKENDWFAQEIIENIRHYATTGKLKMTYLNDAERKEVAKIQEVEKEVAAIDAKLEKNKKPKQEKSEKPAKKKKKETAGE